MMVHALLILPLLLPAPSRSGEPFLPTDFTLSPEVHPDELLGAPQRIVSIAPSITEMCAALGLADRIVGRTQYCTHPPAVQQAAVIGAYADTNFERIISLKPQLVLITDSSSKLKLELEKLRLPTATVPDSTLQDIFAAADKLGDLVARPLTARSLVQRLQQDLERLREHAGRQRATKVLFTFSPLPLQADAIYAVGPGGYLHSLLELAGYSNALEGHVREPWARISAETILAARPDYILEVRPPAKSVDVQRLYNGWSALGSVPAIARRRIRSITGGAAVRPGPRVNLALHEIITALSE